MKKKKAIKDASFITTINIMFNKVEKREKFMKIQRFFRMVLGCFFVLTLLMSSVSISSAINIAGWTGQGGFGALGADGVVALSPFLGSTQYGYVTTAGGLNGVGSLSGVGGTGSPVNGSIITSPLFSADANDELEFYFNYVTSDGSGFADYAWAQLLNDANTQVALLFTARTTTGGDTVPGFEMPAPAATLLPASTPIISGAPNWSPLGNDSGRCFATGCGYTDWVKASYTIAAGGSYYLQFGVTNWDDTFFQSGMAFDGATIAGTQIDDPNVVPEPGTIALLGIGLAGLALLRKRFGKA